MTEFKTQEVDQNPEYVARIEYESKRDAANLAAQEKAYKEQYKFNSRQTALDIATKNNMFINDTDLFLASVDKIYAWLMQDL